MKEGLNESLEKLSELGVDLDVDNPNIEIQNIVVKGNFNKKIDLTTLSIGLGLENTEYEPEQFLGIIYRANSSVVLIFGSGSFIILGADNIRSINSTGDNIREKLIELDVINYICQSASFEVLIFISILKDWRSSIRSRLDFLGTHRPQNHLFRRFLLLSRGRVDHRSHLRRGHVQVSSHHNHGEEHAGVLQE